MATMAEARVAQDTGVASVDGGLAAVMGAARHIATLEVLKRERLGSWSGCWWMLRMPACLAASMMFWPGLMTTARPLMVTTTSASGSGGSALGRAAWSWDRLSALLAAAEW